MRTYENMRNESSNLVRLSDSSYHFKSAAAVGPKALCSQRICFVALANLLEHVSAKPSLGCRCTCQWQ